MVRTGRKCGRRDLNPGYQLGGLPRPTRLDVLDQIVLRHLSKLDDDRSRAIASHPTPYKVLMRWRGLSPPMNRRLSTKHRLASVFSRPRKRLSKPPHAHRGLWNQSSRVHLGPRACPQKNGRAETRRSLRRDSFFPPTSPRNPREFRPYLGWKALPRSPV